mmetsp:Transcript_63146/g.124343  ORF Transcript_63146/g.124343 Transcript_63146/m.124343 type:complete len:1156 (+) Transcript_63146:60-3527(+)|eukprot:CAMPEP_0170383668 /NCGR_PEP_ID=MMETSP0117_2-20130122/15593_1 /TAXON_ID=400756 /ORGANISM="Durinskia baltica, Strain CSIRO CS-38" /LENGTH=1155 /DNA_ID=CAMNT_0010639377 /DNA_START=57 /DNA_END=3524 /DNA_ORIENTATION=+
MAAGSTVFVTTDIALQGADLVSGGIVANVKKGVELMLLNNKFVQDGPAAPSRGQCDVSALLRQGLDFLSKSPHEALGVPVGCRTPEIRKAYKRHALKYHPDKNPLTTPLFQVMSSAHDRLTDPTQRHKEERTAAAKNPKPKPPPPAAPGPPPSGFASAAGGNANAHTPHPNSNPHHPRPTYDPKSNKWSSEAEWGKFQQQPSAAEQSSKAQEAARRKQYYDEILREQFKKAESDRKAKEYAAMREAATRQRAGVNTNASESSAGSNSKPSEPNYYNYQNPNMKKPGAGGSATASDTGSVHAHSRPPPHDNAAAGGAGGGGAGSYAGRNYSYKPTAGAAAGMDTKVNPENVPQYGKIPSREGARDSFAKPSSSKPSTAQKSSGGSARGGMEDSHTHSSYSNSKYSSAGIAGNNSNNNGSSSADHGNSSSNLRNGAKSNASRVPRPYGLRCLFVGTNAAELEWVTSKYHRNSLLAELSWRIKENDPNASWRGTWESASKLISSGKCRKKNLVAGSIYEFRVRAVEELAGGLLGYRSDWSDTVVVTLLPDKTTYSSNNGASSAAQPSPSQKGGHSASKRDLHNKESAFSFTKVDGNANRDSTESQSTSSQQPTEPKHAKVHTFERFGGNQKPSEPAKINIYDQINAEKKEKTAVPVDDVRKSTSSLPVRSNVYDSNTTATEATSGSAGKPKAADTNTPLQEMTKAHVESNVKRFPSRGLTGSGRNVWGPDAHSSGLENEPRATTATGKNKTSTTKSEEKKREGAAAAAGDTKDRSKIKKNGKSKGNDKGDGSDDEEIEEDIKDDLSAAREVDDEVNTVGVDEDSSSVHTTAKKATAAKLNPSTSTTTERKGAAKKDSKKGEFEDFTIEVEDGSDDEDEESDIEDEDDFEVEYEEMYTLVAPPSKVKTNRKSSSSANLGLYSHPVRAEPVPKSTIVGYLVLGTEVLACADAGNWLKVKIHKQPTRKASMRNTDDVVEWGWSIRQDKNHEYLKLSRESLPPLHHPHVTGHKLSSSTESPAPKGTSGTFKSPGGSHYAPSTPLKDKSASTMGNPLGNRSMRAFPKNPNHHHYTPPTAGARLSFNEKNVPVWMELFDEGGHAYYFNEDSGESRWEPPNWVEEKDPTSGEKYYVNLGNASSDPNAPLYSTWTKPAEFARLLRT